MDCIGIDKLTIVAMLPYFLGITVKQPTWTVPTIIEIITDFISDTARELRFYGLKSRPKNGV